MGEIIVPTERPSKLGPANGGTQRRLQWEKNDPRGRTWENLVKGNKMASKGMELKFIPPTIINGKKVVELTREDVVSENEKWKYALIGYMIGGTPTIGEMEQYVAVQGSFEDKPKVYYHNSGYFVINFNYEKDMNKLLYEGSHMLNNKPLILKP